MFRTLRVKDKSAIYDLGITIFREEDELPLLQRALKTCDLTLSYVAVDGKKIVGFTLVGSTPTNVYFNFLSERSHQYELAFLGISPSHQGRGLGTQLLRASMNAVHRISTTFACWLLVDVTNVGAIKMYQKMGFRRWKSTPASLTHQAGFIMGLSHRRYKSIEITG